MTKRITWTHSSAPARRWMNHCRISALACILLAAGGCTVDQEGWEDEGWEDETLDEEPIGETSDALASGAPIPTSMSNPFFQLGTLVTSYPGCTAVIIGKRDLLTAAHCMPQEGDDVSFYFGYLRTSLTRTIETVWYKAGVHPEVEDYTDTNGKFADIAYIRLDDDIHTALGGKPARLPISYPGNNVAGYRVGAGNHGGGSNPSRHMYYDTGTTYSSNVYDGHFLLNEWDTNGGDSGGPFLIANNNGWSTAYEAQGVLYGKHWEWGLHNKYTSTAHHIDWIVDKLWPDPDDHVDWLSQRLHQGTVVKTLYPMNGDRDVCAYHCRQRGDCVGVNYLSFNGGIHMCQMLSSISNTIYYPVSDAGDRDQAP